MIRLRFPRSVVSWGVSLALLVGGASTVMGQAGGGAAAGTGAGGSALEGENRGIMRLQGRVLCTGCSAEDALTKHPGIAKKNLFLLTYENQQVALRVDRVNNAARWDDLTLTDQLQVRGEEQLWQKVVENASQNHDIEIAGVLRNTGTFDLSAVSLAKASAATEGNGVRQE